MESRRGSGSQRKPVDTTPAVSVKGGGMCIWHVDINIDDPDVRVVVLPEKDGMPPFAVARIDGISLYPNHLMKPLVRQLEEIEEMGRRIANAAVAAKPDIGGGAGRVA
jgi:hypothetical protein